jgi:hypothetical protein
LSIGAAFSFLFFFTWFATDDDLIDFALESLGVGGPTTTTSNNNNANANAKVDLIRKGLRLVVERAGNKDPDRILAEAEMLVRSSSSNNNNNTSATAAAAVR